MYWEHAEDCPAHWRVSIKLCTVHRPGPATESRRLSQSQEKSKILFGDKVGEKTVYDLLPQHHIRHARLRHSCPVDLCPNIALPNGVMQQNLRPTTGPHRMHNPGPLPRVPIDLLRAWRSACRKWVVQAALATWRPGDLGDRAIGRPVLSLLAVGGLQNGPLSLPSLSVFPKLGIQEKVPTGLASFNVARLLALLCPSGHIFCEGALCDTCGTQCVLSVQYVCLYNTCRRTTAAGVPWLPLALRRHRESLHCIPGYLG